MNESEPHVVADPSDGRNTPGNAKRCVNFVNMFSSTGVDAAAYLHAGETYSHTREYHKNVLCKGLLLCTISSVMPPRIGYRGSRVACPKGTAKQAASCVRRLSTVRSRIIARQTQTKNRQVPGQLGFACGRTSCFWS